jgi:hypothetical protein
VKSKDLSNRGVYGYYYAMGHYNLDLAHATFGLT